jgi:vitamin B12 transporter
MKALALFAPGLLVLAGLAGTAQAQDLSTLVVTANRAPVPADQVGASLTVLDEAAIRRSQATAAVELLARTPGLTYARNGGPGQAASIYIRGGETDQTAVLIDGVKLNDPAAPGGGYNAGKLMVGDIARIEVLRGAQSTLWGSQAIGGVVNLITRQPTRPFEADGQVEGGSLDSLYARAGLGGKTERLTLRANAGYAVTGGVSAYAREDGGRERDGYRNLGLNGRALYAFSGAVSAEARAVWSKSHNAYDDFDGDAPVSGDTRELTAYAGLNAALFGGRLKNRIAHAYTDTDRTDVDPRQAGSPVSFASDGRNRRWEYQGVLAVREGWTATFGAESERSRMQAASPFSNDIGRSGIDSLYGQVQATLAPGLTLTGGLRHDDHQAFGGHTLGQAAAAWSLNDGATVLRASWGEGFKAPSLYQLYSEYGNLALRPEEGRSWDVGVQHRLLAPITLQATYFGRRTTDLIDFVSCTAAQAGDPRCTGRFGFYDNVAGAKAQGVELAADLTLGGLFASANYTYLDATNRSPVNRGKALARRPRDAANLTVGYRWGSGLSAEAAVRHAGASWNDAANSQRLEAYTLVDLRAAYAVTPRVELYSRVENLFDERYQTVLSYGTLGRTAYAGVRAKL